MSSDGQLLQRFAAERSEAAFEGLVRRHGAMVFGACERLLGDRHDAEDAFQAVFIVLARNAARLRKSDSVASWLHGVALRVGLSARRQAARRREHERRAAEMATTESATAWRELGPVLDEELGRLPEKLRAPVVLCYLEDKSTEEAAEELGWTHGALRGRLSKARDLLRGRLSRRGIVVGAALLASVISENGSAAAVPPACVASTVQAAAAMSAGGALASSGLGGNALALAEGALRGMFRAKVQTAGSAAVAGAGLLLATALVARVLSSSEEPAAAVAPGALVAAAPARVEADGPSSRREPASPPRVSGAKIETASAGGAPPPGPAGAPDINDRRDEQPGVPGLPEAVSRSLAAFRPGASVRKVKRKAKGGRTVYEVDLDAGGKDLEAKLSEDGTVLESKEELDVEALPRAVTDAVAELYPGAVINEADRETRGDRTVFELEVEVDGEEHDLALGPDGTVVVDEDEDDGEENGEEEEHEQREEEQREEGQREDGNEEAQPGAIPLGGAVPEAF